MGEITVAVGEQRGDEGKGRFVDMLAEEHDIIARYNGGPNAGHSVVMPNGKELKLHGIPSGIGYPDKMNVIGDGEYIDVTKLCVEIDYLVEEKDIEVSPANLLISSSSHLILPHHIILDMRREAGDGGQGSTKSGIAYVDADFALREGMRAEVINNSPDELRERIKRQLLSLSPLSHTELESLGGFDEEATAARYAENALRLGPFITDTALFLNNALKAGKKILAEGAQAFLLDKYQGMWPNVTSSITTSGGVSPGLGVPPQTIGRVLGVAKAVQSHVGGGHFVTEIHEASELERMHGDLSAGDAERGTTTGRTRRLGHLDIPLLRRANMVNGTTEMAITKLDWLSRYVDVIPVCVSYSRKGKELSVAPNAEYKLKESTPNYEELSAWSEDISNIRAFDDLPLAAQRYIDFLEEQTDVPIRMIGVGPRRDQVIVRT